MKKRLLATVIAASFAMTACQQDDKASAPAALDNDMQKVSYGIAYNIAGNFRDQKIELDSKAFQRGLEDGLAGNESALSQEEIMAAMQGFQQQQMEKQQAEQEAAASTNKAEAEKFFAENGKKDGVKTTESGLQYKVISASGSDKKPGLDDTVVVHYRGTLLNGEEFDSSYSRNKPATFGLSHVIPGWTEGLQLMNVGDKYELYIPSELAYGAGGAGNKIGPHQALKFEVELLDVVDDTEPKSPAEASSSSAEKGELTSDDLQQ
ncbi:MAG TPA: FKBP-type peptidyl-prolyl cis-trans isomerase [Pseudomonadales bacterium]